MSHLLRSDEKQLGRYKVRFTKFTAGHWHVYGPWMRVIVTSQRLIVLPDDVQREDATPLVIPAENIARVWSIGLGRRDGGVIALRSGTLLYFYVEWSQSVRLMRDVGKMLKAAAPVPAATAAGNKRYYN